jgi:hypothetical protein
MRRRKNSRAKKEPLSAAPGSCNFVGYAMTPTNTSPSGNSIAREGSGSIIGALYASDPSTEIGTKVLFFPDELKGSSVMVIEPPVAMAIVFVPPVNVKVEPLALPTTVSLSVPPGMLSCKPLPPVKIKVKSIV